MLVKKIHCLNPNHVDQTPSCAVYDDGTGYCFGCGTYFSKIEGIEFKIEKKEKEDVSKTIEYIESLPTMPHRGFIFHYDNTGYYILWPYRDYYKLRRWVSKTTSDRYISPRGVSKPIFRLEHSSAPFLFIVEGEINAMSLAKYVRPEYSIISPGSAGDFNSKTMINTLPEFKKYANILICVDEDVPGIQAAIKLKRKLVNYCLNSEIELMSKDFNELDTQSDYEKINKIIERMGVQKGV